MNGTTSWGWQKRRGWLSKSYWKRLVTAKAGAALGVASKDDVIVARFEAILEAQYALHKVGTEPVVLVEHHPLRQPLS